MAYYLISNLDALLETLDKEEFKTSEMFGRTLGVYDTKERKPNGFIEESSARVVTIAGRRLDRFMGSYKEA